MLKGRLVGVGVPILVWLGEKDSGQFRWRWGMCGESIPRSAIEAAERAVESITKEGQSMGKEEDQALVDSDICGILKKKLKLVKGYWW